ncbi:MAG: hypothetical protein AAF631_01295 [Pseudomonadota bacterium]
MTKVSFALFMERLWQSQGPEETRDLMLQLGFNGLVFQRWSLDFIENWEGRIMRGFLEHYYGAELDQHCPIAKAIHTWSRNYTFGEARRQLTASLDRGNANRVVRLFSRFGMEDGVVLLTGTNTNRSSVILTSARPCQDVFDQFGGVLAFAAHRLTDQLPSGHDLLTPVPRKQPQLSEMQSRILQMQIDNPEMSNGEIAMALGMSPKTLHTHHKKIAKKTGVTTFAGAVIKQMKEKIR